MRWPQFSTRGTVERRLTYFRYADPDAIQIYQGLCLSMVSIALILGRTSLLGDAVVLYYNAWPTTGYYMLAAAALSWACLVVDPRSANAAPGVMLLGTCSVYWATMAGELLKRFGFVPLSHALVSFMAVMAMYGCVRFMR